MELIELLMIVVSFFLLYISLNKKDSTLIYFSGFLILLNGLNLMNYNVFNFSNLYIQGVIFVFLAIYLLVRTSIELIQDKKD